MKKNMTQIEKSDASIKENEQRFRTLYQNSPCSIYTWKRKNNDFILIDYNKSVEEITEGKISNLVGVRATELYGYLPNIMHTVELYR